jgi:protein TonB
MKYILVFFLIAIGMGPQVLAQDTVPAGVFSACEKPRFPGGNAGLRQFLSLNLRYPNAALEAKVSGEVVVEFLLDENGHAREARVLDGIGYGCDEEAIRVVNEMPCWEPALISGTPVKCRYELPVVFELPGADRTPRKVKRTKF